MTDPQTYQATSRVNATYGLRDALTDAAKSGDWITPYAMHLASAGWVVAGIDKGEGDGRSDS